MDIVRACAIGLMVVAVAVAIHHTLRWMDRKGWVFYGSEPTTPLGVRSAMALMEFETLVNPAVEHVLEYRRHGDQWVQAQGLDDDDDGTDHVPPQKLHG